MTKGFLGSAVEEIDKDRIQSECDNAFYSDDAVSENEYQPSPSRSFLSSAVEESEKEPVSYRDDQKLEPTHAIALEASTLNTKIGLSFSDDQVEAVANVISPFLDKFFESTTYDDFMQKRFAMPYSLSETSASVIRQGSLLYDLFRIGDSRFTYEDMMDVTREINKPFNVVEELEKAGIDEKDYHKFIDAVNIVELRNKIKYHKWDKKDAEVLGQTGDVVSGAIRVGVSVAEGISIGKQVPVLDILEGYPLPATMALDTFLYNVVKTNAHDVSVDRDVDFSGNLLYSAETALMVGAMTGLWIGALNFSRTKKNEIKLESSLEDVIDDSVDSVFSFKSGVANDNSFGESLKSFKNNLKHPNNYFDMNSGKLMDASTGKGVVLKEQGKRWTWEFLNSTPQYQMHYSGDEKLKLLTPKLFGNKHFRFSDSGVVNELAVDEVIHLTAMKEGKVLTVIAKEKADFVKAGGTVEEFDKGLAGFIANTHVNIKTGELVYGRLPTDPEQLHLFLNKTKSSKAPTKNINAYSEKELQAGNNPVKGQREFDFYNDEHLRGIGLTRTFDKYASEYAPNIKRAGSEYINFWRDILEKGKSQGVLEEHFADEAIRISGKKALTVDLANMESEKFIDAVKKETIEHTDLLSLGHFSRRYHLDKIKENRDAFKALMYRSYYMNGVRDPQVIKDSISEAATNIFGLSVKDSKQSEAVASILKERKIAINDEILINSGYVSGDIGTQRGTWRKLVADTELNKAAKSVGYDTWSDLKNAYKVKSNTEIGKIIMNESESVAIANARARQYNFTLLDDVENLLKGTFNKLDNKTASWASAGKAITYLSSSGAISISYLPDMGYIFMKSHMYTGSFIKATKVTGKALINALGRTLKSFPPGVENLYKKTKSAIKDKSMQPYWDTTLNRVYQDDFTRLTGCFEDAINKSRYIDLGYSQNPRWLENGVRIQDKITMATAINRVFKETSMQIELDHLLSQCLKEEANKEYLSLMGISEVRRQEIANAYREYGREYKGFKFLDFDKYLNGDTRDTVMGSLYTIVDQSTQTARIGNIPRTLRSPLGQMFLMFKSYPYIIYDNIVRPAMSKSGVFTAGNLAVGVSTAISLSIARKYIADYFNRKDTNPDSGEFWDEVIDYAGAGSQYLDYWNTFKKLREREYRGAVERISPIMSKANQLTEYFGKAFDPELKADHKKILTSLPIINALYLRRLYNDKNYAVIE